MATLGASVVTLADWAKMLDPDGRVSAVAELLTQRNQILDDMSWIEGNLPTGHQYGARTGLPSVYWRMMNEGIASSKATSAQATDTCGNLEAYSEIDKDVVELNGNTSEFRLSQAKAFIQSMNNEFAATLFYGNSSLAPEEFTGLAPRYSDLSAANSDNIIDAGGSSTDNSSIWLINWDKETVSGIFPKGSKAGLSHEDLGVVTVETTAGVAGNRMRAYQDHFQWKCGVMVDGRLAA